MNKCKKKCNQNPDCKAFHWYLLDPKGTSNCWIWTSDQYVGDGSEKAYCFKKMPEGWENPKKEKKPKKNKKDKKDEDEDEDDDEELDEQLVEEVDE